MHRLREYRQCRAYGDEAPGTWELLPRGVLQMTAETVSKGRIGDRVTRLEDNRLVTGNTRYVDDITPPGTLHLRFVRSQHAHAVIKDVIPGEFEELPHDALVFTGKDFVGLGIRADVRDVPPVGEPHDRGYDNAPTVLYSRWQTSLLPCLTDGIVGYVGEHVVV